MLNIIKGFNMAKLQFSENMLIREAKKGKWTLNMPCWYRGILYMTSFFDIDKREISLDRLLSNRSGYTTISFDDFLKFAYRLNQKEYNEIKRKNPHKIL